MMHPEETVRTICALYNGHSDYAIDKITSSDLHTLAIDWSKMRKLLTDINDQLITSETTARELQREISNVLTVRDFLGRAISRADFDAEMKAHKIEQNYR